MAGCEMNQEKPCEILEDTDEPSERDLKAWTLVGEGCFQRENLPGAE